MSTPDRRPQRRLATKSWQDVADYREEAGERACAVVPVGAVEAHGVHAPLATDTYIAERIAGDLAERVGALVCPAVPFGTLHVGYEFDHPPGSISLRPETLVALCGDVGRELGRHGLDPVVFVNGHGPNGHPLALAAAEIHHGSGIRAGVLDWWTGGREEITEIKGFAYANHADEIETSLVLASAGAEHVDLSRAVANSTTLDDLTDAERRVYHAKLTFTHTFDERWVGSSGNMGDPRGATAEKGERIVGATVDLGTALVEALRQQPSRADRPPKDRP